MRKIVMIMALLGVCFQTELKAQDKVEAEVAADVVNQYIWRGQELETPAFSHH